MVVLRLVWEPVQTEVLEAMLPQVSAATQMAVHLEALELA
jgi:hypothetical protein